MVPDRDRPYRNSEKNPEESGALKNPFEPIRAVVSDIKLETVDVKTYRVIPDRSLYSPKPGQFNMVGLAGVGEAPISFSSISSGSEFEHTIRSVGRVTKFLEKLKKGDEIFVRGPYGSCWPLDKSVGQDVVLVAGGVGLAPIRPVIHEILSKRDFFGRVALIHGARRPADILFSHELRTWKKYIDVLLTVDEVPADVVWDYNIGLVTELLDNMSLSPERTFAFVCGPEIMMRFIARGLFLKGLFASKVYISLERRMKCGIGQCGHCQHGTKFVCKDGPIFLYKDVNIFPDGLL
jgi:NAD(P)H-flavin reductase